MDAENAGKIEGRHSLTQFNSYEEIKAWSQELAAANDNTQLVTYGQSGEGRDLFTLEIGSGSKVISVDCGIHAREWASPAYCQWFLDQIYNGQFAKYTTDIKFLVTPVVNPDGYAYTWNSDRMWRKNRSANPGSICVGTDLNRNYDAKWSGVGASGNACAENYYGSGVFSEKESAAQRDYLAPYINNGSLKAFATFHSYGQYILYPYSYDFISKPGNGDELNSVGAGMASAITAISGKQYTMGQGTDVLYPAAGGSDDWAYDAMKNAGNSAPLSYTFELRDKGRYGFIQPANEIKPNCEEIDGSMEYLIKHVKDNK